MAEQGKSKTKRLSAEDRASKLVKKELASLGDGELEARLGRLEDEVRDYAEEVFRPYLGEAQYETGARSEEELLNRQIEGINWDDRTAPKVFEMHIASEMGHLTGEQEKRLAAVKRRVAELAPFLEREHLTVPDVPLE